MSERTEVTILSGASLKTSEINLVTEPFIVGTELDGVFLIQRPYYSDVRGGFQEDFRVPDLEAVVGHEIRILQVQGSDSHPEVFRGWHVDKQDKMVTPKVGHILGIFVDLRQDSTSFRKTLQIEFNVKDGVRRMTVFLPDGVGNSFYVYPDSPEAVYCYCVTSIYDPENSKRAVGLNDTSLRSLIPSDNPIASDKDRMGLTVEEFVEKFMKDNNG